MNLPKFSPIQTVPVRSTYYTFSKALKDFDKSVVEDSPYYFTKMVALNLPAWNNNPGSNLFFEFRKTTSTPSGDLDCYTEVAPDLLEDIDDYINPNLVIPKMFQYYMENIMRQTNINEDQSVQERITEIAFWKTLNKLGLNTDHIYGLNQTPSIVTFINHVNISNFINVSNNNGWCELIGSIPNNSELLTINQNSWEELTDVDSLILADINNDTAIYDNDNNGFGFDMQNLKKVLNFDYIYQNNFDSDTQSSFDFNTLLLFYKDSTGLEKLHGISFIFPFTGTEVDGISQQTLHHETNKIQAFGYSFKFLMKSNNNTPTVTEVYNQNEGTFFDSFEEVMGSFNSFLELQIQQGKII